MYLKMKKSILVLSLLFFYCKEAPQEVKQNNNLSELKNQENILNWKEVWTEGVGSIEGYRSFGKEEESRRVIKLDPNKEKSIMWECIPDSSTVWDGGFMTSQLEIDNNYPYLFIAWVKKTAGESTGRAYYAFDGLEETTGETVKNANFIGAGSSIKKLNEWHTFVGYIYPNSYQDNIEADVNSGLYYRGKMIQEGRDFKWKIDAKNTSIRVMLIGNQEQSEERLYIWNPQLYKIDGTEPKLSNLISTSIIE